MKNSVKPELFWYQNLTGGMDQATDFQLVENNASELLKNVVMDRPGTWSRRKGTALIGNVTSGGDDIWGLFTYNKSDGTHTFMRVNNRDLQVFNGTDTWTSTDTDEWTASKKVNGANYLDRLYLGCEDGTTPLAWVVATGTLTDITPTIGGHCLAVNKSILAVGGNAIKPNVIFYSDPYTDTFYSATGTCAANADSGGANTVTTTTEIFEPDMIGGVIYNTTEGVMNLITAWTDGDTITTDAATATWDNDTVYIMQNIFTQDGEVTGIVGFNDTFISFDEDNMYIWDPTSQWSQKLPGFGCVNERSIAVMDGVLIWADREGVYLYNGTDRPMDISGRIKDPVYGYGLWDLINDSNWGTIAAGGFDGKYYLSVGTLSTLSGAPASALANAELVFDLASGTWAVNSRDSIPTVYATFINSSGSKDLYYGEQAASAVYKMNTGTTDATDAGGTAAITFEARTPHFVFSDPTVKWRIKECYVRYTGSGTVTATISKDHGSYGTFASLSSASTSTEVCILPPADCQAFTFSLKFVATAATSIEAVGFLAEPISFGSVAT